MPATAVKYQNLEALNNERDAVAWYWKLIALVSSVMILGGYLILPATFDKTPELRFSSGILSILIVTVLTTGYSFTALLCFACRNWKFQAESVFLPALTSSTLGLLTVMWCFASSERYRWTTATSVMTALAAGATTLYSILLFLTHRKIHNFRKQAANERFSWGDTSYYKNYIANMYPSFQSHEILAQSHDDPSLQRLALLLQRHDPGPSPEASQSTFRIDMPEEPIHEPMSREMRGTHGTRPQRSTTQDYQRVRTSQSPPATRSTLGRIAETISGSRGRAASNDGLTIGNERGRDSRRGNNGPRALSREERRQQIEMGNL